MASIAVIDSNEESRRRISRILRADGLEPIEAANGLEALRSAFVERPDAALVDLSTSGIDGVELVRILRAACDIPIIALLEDAASGEVVRALEAGADDVVEKQCPALELLARINAAIRRYQRRRNQPDGARQLFTGDLVVNREAQIVTKRGLPVPLTRTEFRLLDALASHLGEIISHRQLLTEVWGDEYVDDTHYVRVYIGYLRNKLEDDPASPRYLMNEWGIGYRLARLPIGEVNTAETQVSVTV